MEKKYTEEDLIEIIKLHDSALETVQSFIHNIRILNSIDNKDGINKELNRLDIFLYNQRLYNSKDIKISEFNAKNTNSL